MKKWFSNLKVSQKLMLISVFFVMPDSVMLYLFITGINENIQFARMEKKGNEYQRPLEDLLELFPQHARLANRFLHGDKSVAAALAEKQAEIETAFNVLVEVDARLGVELQFTDEGLAKRNRQQFRVGIVRSKWAALKASLNQLTPEDAADKHLLLVAAIRTMITHAGDMSNLILDPDLDSYYLMDATLLALPQAQDRLSMILTHGENALQDAQLTNKERQTFAIYATMFKEADFERIVGSIQTALNEDVNFYGISPTLQARVPPALKEFETAAERLIEMTKKLVDSEKPEVTTEEYYAAGTAARTASFKLWRIADEEVDTLLQKRIDAYVHRRASSLVVAACALLAAIGFVTFITRSISRPLQQQAAELTAANAALQVEIADRKRAEQMAAELNKQLVIVARQSGMAEVASSVLHNAGNVLNSVNVSATLITEQIKRSQLAGLRELAELMKEQSGRLSEFVATDPRGRQLPDFIALLAECWEKEQAEEVKELDHLNRNIQHVKDIIATQQSLTGTSGFEEPVKLNHVLENALKIAAASLEHNSISVKREYADLPPTLVDKSKLLQILINLLQNAKDAVAARAPGEKTITIKTMKNDDTYVIRVADNGVGIQPGDLTRIFSFGFTTKSNGHGIGLHYSALSAKSLGGSLTATSAGPDKGATFTLVLPYKEAEVLQ